MGFSVRVTLGLDQLQGAGAGEGLGAAGDLQLTKNTIGVGLNGAEGDHQGLRNFGVGFADGNQAEHLQLALAKGLDKILARLEAVAF